MRKTYRAVMFDLDGTLTDTLADLANATNHALAALGFPTHPIEAYRYLVGDGARVLCERALPADQQGRATDLLPLMRAHYAAHWAEETTVYPGIGELLAELTMRKLKLAVLSNKPDEFTKHVVAHYFPANPFQVVRGALAHVPLKPDPAAALQIAAELEIPPAEWLYLGDTNTDMRTAHAARMHGVGVLWGFRDRIELEEAGAATVIAHPRELLRLL